MEHLSMEEKITLIDAVKRYGDTGQTLKAIEEMGELTQALCKLMTRTEEDCTVGMLWSHVAEEMADVYIMLEQMQIIYANHDSVEDWIHWKLARLRTRLDKEG